MVDLQAEQNLIDVVGGDGVLDKLAKHNHAQNVQKLANAVGDTHLKRVNKDRRNRADGFTDDRSMRQILEIPIEVAFALEEIYGKRFWADKKILKKALDKDEFLQEFLTVPKNTI